MASCRERAGPTSSFTSAPSRVTASSRWPRAIASSSKSFKVKRGRKPLTSQRCDRVRTSAANASAVAEAFSSTRVRGVHEAAGGTNSACMKRVARRCAARHVPTRGKAGSCSPSRRFSGCREEAAGSRARPAIASRRDAIVRR